MDANVLIYGSIIQTGIKIRVNAQLIDSKTKEILKPFEIDGPFEEDAILPIIDSLKRMVRRFLVISKLEKEITPEFQPIASTNSPEAYRCFLYGENARRKLDWPTAVKWYSEALKIDSNYVAATIMLCYADGYLGLFADAKKLCYKVYQKRDQMPRLLKIWMNFAYARCFETPNEELKYIQELQEIDDQLPFVYYYLGSIYRRLNQYDKAINEYEKALEIYAKWGSKPFWVMNYTYLGREYHETGQYKKEEELYAKAKQDFPDDHLLIYRQAVLSMTIGDTIAADQYLKKYVSIRKDNSEASITTSIADIYSEAGILDKAEGNYRKALSLETLTPGRLNNLAYFLIDKDRNINEGLELVDKALELRPDNYSYLHTKGWGLYKQGKYKEALEILQKSGNLRMKNAGYSHEAFLHLEEAKKAVANQKKN